MAVFVVRWHWQELEKQGRFTQNSADNKGNPMLPANEVLCSLFIPLVITLGLICVVALQYAFHGDEF